MIFFFLVSERTDERPPKYANKQARVRRRSVPCVGSLQTKTTDRSVGDPSKRTDDDGCGGC